MGGSFNNGCSTTCERLLAEMCRSAWGVLLGGVTAACDAVVDSCTGATSGSTKYASSLRRMISSRISLRLCTISSSLMLPLLEVVVDALEVLPPLMDEDTGTGDDCPAVGLALPLPSA